MQRLVLIPASALLALLAAIVGVRVAGSGSWATDLLYWASLLLLPFLMTRSGALGLAPRRWRRSIFVFVCLSFATLPAYVLIRWAVDGPPTRRLDELTSVAWTQILLVALPEELFFRGFLQGQWAAARGGRSISLLGARVGWEWPAVAAAFALAHVLQTGPSGVATFLPALLFGWSYARTGSIWTGVLYHGACNVVVQAWG